MSTPIAGKVDGVIFSNTPGNRVYLKIRGKYLDDVLEDGVVVKYSERVTATAEILERDATDGKFLLVRYEVPESLPVDGDEIEITVTNDEGSDSTVYP